VSRGRDEEAEGVKIAEALIERGDLQERIQEMRTRLTANVVVQEGEEPNEPPDELVAELERLVRDFQRLVARINLTNTRTPLVNWTGAPLLLTEALARREALALQPGIIEATVSQAARGAQGMRLSRSEIKLVPVINARAWRQRHLDPLAKQRRALETAIQATNWAAELLEAETALDSTAP
jgi:hypothetical protein